MPVTPGYFAVPDRGWIVANLFIGGILGSGRPNLHSLEKSARNGLGSVSSMTSDQKKVIIMAL
jgi:hypothetical protein